ncbi:MAG TPA: acyl-CoA dehydrogenase family protein [Catenuloplanes sp.]|jgi:hypothetical protein
MDFAPDETEQVIARVAGETLDRIDAGQPERVWKSLAQAGMLSLAVPAWLGGEGLGVLAVGTLLTEVGRRAAAVPALATLALGALPVVRWGSREQQRELLTGLPAGDVVLTAAVRELSDPLPATPRTTAAADLTVTGTKVGVPYARQAHRILVPVSLATGGTAVAVIDPAGPGVSVHRAPGRGTGPEYTLRLAGAPATGLLGDGPGAPVVADLYRCAVAGACAVGDGALAGALALTAAHVGSREQFGRPLAAFQAVAQQVADVYLAARTLHLATVSARWRLATDRPAATELAVAAYWLASAAPPALRTCHHLHGGLGVDISYPLHRHWALIRDLVRLVGGVDYCLERLGDRRCSST